MALDSKSKQCLEQTQGDLWEKGTLSESRIGATCRREGSVFALTEAFLMSQARPVTAVENCTVLFSEFVTLFTLVSESPISHVT